VRRLVWLVVSDRYGAIAIPFGTRRRIRIGAAAKLPLDCDRDILVDGAGVRLLFLDTELRQQLKDTIRLNL
jgi:hypothetical protein